MAKKSVEDRWWAVSRLAAKAVYIGRVKAADAESTIDTAIEQFGVRAELRNRLVARVDR